ncbi:MAG TPA: hypothetical protein VEF55_03420 [Candidatus Binatia bacterium]|nr:hypothetical protein [Candidatus Binatia bacterium]
MNLRNIGLTALMVIVATMATAGVTIIGLVLVMSDDALSAAGALGGMGGAIASIAAFIGLFFAPISLAIAGVTMPPTLIFADRLGLPRPAIDIVGGAVAGVLVGFLCAEMVLDAFEGLARSKGGGAMSDAYRMQADLVFACFGFLGGSILGWARHRFLVSARTAAPVLRTA